MLEVMIVIAIIAIVAALAGSASQRQSRKVRIHDAARHFRSRVEHARTLAIAAGPRLGNPLLFRNCPGGGGPPGANLALTIDPGAGTYSVPTNLALSPGGAVLNSTCQTFNINDESESNGHSRLTANGGNATVNIGFTPNGRLDPAATTLVGPQFVRFEDALEANEATRGYGFRILPSGVICTASGVAGTGCSEDAI